VELKTREQAANYGAMRAKLLLALDQTLTADDVDMVAAMDTLRGVACKMSRDEWDAMYDHLNAEDHPGRPEAMDKYDDMEPRGGAMKPWSGGVRGEKRPKAMDAATAKSFEQLYGAPLLRSYAGDYGVLASDGTPLIASISFFLRPCNGDRET
jgi:hypothetical protein